MYVPHLYMTCPPLVITAARPSSHNNVGEIQPICRRECVATAVLDCRRAKEWRSQLWLIFFFPFDSVGYWVFFWWSCGVFKYLRETMSYCCLYTETFMSRWSWKFFVCLPGGLEAAGQENALWKPHHYVHAERISQSCSQGRENVFIISFPRLLYRHSPCNYHSKLTIVSTIHSRYDCRHFLLHPSDKEWLSGHGHNCHESPT